MKPLLVYPNRSDYEESVTHFQKFVRAPQFAGGQPLRAKHGSPPPLISFSGGYSMVYPVDVGLRRLALRCWIQDPGNVKQRCTRVADYLRRTSMSYFVDFGYVEDGIVARGAKYPICYMQWIEGQTLTEFIEANITSKSILNQLSRQFLRMVEALHENAVAHGDLQDGNILLHQTAQGTELKLVDYDCVYVPTLPDDALPASLQGVPDYQHPKRCHRSREKADYFSELVIYLSLRAYEENQKLWKKGQEKNLLFSEADFLNPGGSQVFAQLDQMSEEVHALSRQLKQYCFQSDTNQFLPLERVVSANGKPTFLNLFGSTPNASSPASATVRAHPTPVPASAPLRPTNETLRPTPWVGDLEGFFNPESHTINQPATPQAQPPAAPLPSPPPKRQEPDFYLAHTERETSRLSSPPPKPQEADAGWQFERKQVVGTLVGGGLAAGLGGLVWGANWLLLKALGLVLPAVSGDDRFRQQLALLWFAWVLLGSFGSILLLLCKAKDGPVVACTLFCILLGCSGISLLAWPLVGLSTIVVIGTVAGYARSHSS